MLALIEDLLDYSKIEAGRFDPEPQPMSVREIADNIIELLAARAFAKDIGLGCHVEPRRPADDHRRPGPGQAGAAQPHRQRHQVHRQRRRAGRASRAPRTETSDRICFTIADTGPGLRDEDMERIFEEFEQADGTSTRTHGGAGLGLAISKRLVTAMGGTISVSSRLGQGSGIRLRNPGTRRPPTRRRAGRMRLPAGTR